MEQSRQTQLLLELAESLPSIAFFLIWRQTGDLELAGWVGCGLAIAALAMFAATKNRMNPVLLGVNCHLLLATPLIVGLFRFGDTEIAELLAAHSHGGVLLTVTVAGVLLTVFSRAGFAGAPDLPAQLRRRLSVLMISVSAIGTAWAFRTPESSLLPVVATLMLLIVGRRLALARWSDGSGGMGVLGGAGVHGQGLSDVSA